MQSFCDKHHQHPHCHVSVFKSTGLIKLAMMLIKRSDHVLSTQVGITHAQFHVLMLVQCLTPITQSELSKYLHSTQAAISRLTDTLVTKGLLARSENPENRRSNQLAITPEGLAVVEQAITIITDIEEKLYASIETKTLKQWQHTTQKVLELLG